MLMTRGCALLCRGDGDIDASNVSACIIKRSRKLSGISSDS